MDPSVVASDPQAVATIEAARIAARATLAAGWIQGGAAMGAIAGGALAYFGAVRQVRLQERAHQARALAYKFRQAKLLRAYLAQVSDALRMARTQSHNHDCGGDAVEIATLRVVRPRALHDENWETHALLGRRAVELILVIEDASLHLAEFDQEIASERVMTDAVFQCGSRTAGATDQGFVTVHLRTAIHDYVHVLARLQSALDALLHEMERPSGAPSITRPLSGLRQRVTELRDHLIGQDPASGPSHITHDRVEPASGPAAYERIPER